MSLTYEWTNEPTDGNGHVSYRVTCALIKNIECHSRREVEADKAALVADGWAGAENLKKVTL